MRATCLMLFAACLVGCGRIDSSRSNPNIDTSPETMRRSGDTTPGPAAPTEDATSIPPAPAVGATDRAAGEPAAPPAPDNTAVNVRDTDRETRNPKLPIDQKETQADVDLTAKIRQEVLKIEDLSINARNCKIITSDGHVTLRGPVNSATERELIVKTARQIAGEANVDDQLEVTPANR
jgi:hyperosmotically inducible periplasmic protein